MTTDRQPMFASVLCGADNGAIGYAARREAELLASGGGAVQVVPARALIRLGPGELRERCRGHDLLVVANGPGAQRTLEYAPIPALLARWCPAGPAELARSILVVVDERDVSEQPVDFAGRLAARHAGTVTLLPAPRHSPALERALNASERIVMQHTGAAPSVLDRHLPLEQAIAARCADVAASLLVLSTGEHWMPPRTAADLAARVGCSVLAVPVPAPAPAPAIVASADRRRELVPA